MKGAFTMGNSIRVFRSEAEAKAFAEEVGGRCQLTKAWRCTETGTQVRLPDEWWVDWDDPNWKPLF